MKIDNLLLYVSKAFQTSKKGKSIIVKIKRIWYVLFQLIFLNVKIWFLVKWKNIYSAMHNHFDNQNKL